MSKDRFKGSALVEYAIPTALLTMTMIAFAANGGFMQDMAGLVADTANGANAGGNIMVRGYGQDVSSGQMDGWLKLYGYEGETKSLSFTTANGNEIILDNFPVDMASNVETMGTNGTTKVLAQALAQLASQLEKAGELEERDANTLKQLAESGFKISELQGLLGDAAVDVATKNEYNTYGIQYNGNTYTPEELRTTFLSVSTRDNEYDILNDYSDSMNGNNEMKYFSIYFEEARDNGALSDPAVLELVTALSYDIVKSAQLSNQLVADASTSDQPDLTYYAGLDDITYMDSDGICTAGGGFTQGQNCN